jgi:hypothetical protein
MKSVELHKVVGEEVEGRHPGCIVTVLEPGVDFRLVKAEATSEDCDRE